MLTTEPEQLGNLKPLRAGLGKRHHRQVAHPQVTLVKTEQDPPPVTNKNLTILRETPVAIRLWHPLQLTRCARLIHPQSYQT